MPYYEKQTRRWKRTLLLVISPNDGSVANGKNIAIKKYGSHTNLYGFIYESRWKGKMLLCEYTIHKYKNIQIQIQIHKYKYKYKYTNTPICIDSYIRAGGEGWKEKVPECCFCEYTILLWIYNTRRILYEYVYMNTCMENVWQCFEIWIGVVEFYDDALKVIHCINLWTLLYYEKYTYIVMHMYI